MVEGKQVHGNVVLSVSDFSRTIINIRSVFGDPVCCTVWIFSCSAFPEHPLTSVLFFAAIPKDLVLALCPLLYRRSNRSAIEIFNLMGIMNIGRAFLQISSSDLAACPLFSPSALVGGLFLGRYMILAFMMD
jgi:hypothetical protein